MAIEIPLTQGMSTLIDEIDVPFINHYKWHAHNTGKNRNKDRWYASAGFRVSPGRRCRLLTVLLHRLIMGARPGEMVDHIDGDSLNNTRENLRLASRSQNKMNADGHQNSKSGYKGVSFQKGTWQARITREGKTLEIGKYPTIEEAARAYDRKAAELFGDFARLNFPQ